MAGRQTLQRGIDPALLVRDVRQLQPHFHAAERTCQHQVIEVPQMPDAKYFSGQAPETFHQG